MVCERLSLKGPTQAGLPRERASGGHLVLRARWLVAWRHPPLARQQRLPLQRGRSCGLAVWWVEGTSQLWWWLVETCLHSSCDCADTRCRFSEVRPVFQQGRETQEHPSPDTECVIVTKHLHVMEDDSKEGETGTRHTHVYTHVHTHMRTHTCTHTCAHAHTWPYPPRNHRRDFNPTLVVACQEALLGWTSCLIYI